MSSPKSTIRSQGGASLIEVLISMFLVAFTMLALLALQTRSTAMQKDSRDRRTAAMLVQMFAERVAANYEGFELNAYDGLRMDAADVPPATVPACTNCTNAQLAAADWAVLQRAVRANLPQGLAVVETPDNQAWISVVLGWADVRREETAIGVDPVCNSIGITDPLFRCYAANISP